MQRRHHAPALVGQQDGLAVGGLDDQGPARLGGGQPVGLEGARGVDVAGLGVEEHLRAVDLAQLLPRSEAQGALHGPAPRAHGPGVVAHVQGDVAAAIRPAGARGPRPEGAAHAVQPGKGEGNQSRFLVHRVCSSVMITSTGTSHGSAGSSATSWKPKHGAASSGPGRPSPARNRS